eukprot:1751007-Alexandrium_andersonii.AAC.1
MSASLVGSEMCIRDRQSIADAYNNTNGYTKPSKRSEDQNKGGTPNASPVSYTHLTLPTICSV